MPVTPQLVSYLNLQIVSPNPIGDAGLAINNNFIALANQTSSLTTSVTANTSSIASLNTTVGALGATYLALAGGKMTGDILIPNNKIAFASSGTVYNSYINFSAVQVASTLDHSGGNMSQGFAAFNSGITNIRTATLDFYISGSQLSIGTPSIVSNNVTRTTPFTIDNSGNIVANNTTLHGNLTFSNSAEIETSSGDIVVNATGGTLFLSGDNGISVESSMTLNDSTFADGQIYAIGGINMQDASISGTYAYQFNSSGQIQDDGAGGFNFYDNYGLILEFNTANEGFSSSTGTVFDDSSGNMYVSGNLRVANELIFGNSTTQTTAWTGTIAASAITSGIIANARLGSLTVVKGVIFDNGGVVISTGTNASVQIPFNATVTGWTVISQDNTSGSITIDVLTVSEANLVPNATTNATSIVSTGTKPNLTSQTKNTSTTLTSWSTNITGGQYLIFNVTGSVTNVDTVRIELTLAPR